MPWRRISFICLLGGCVLAGAPAGFAQSFKQGGEFQVNARTTGSQSLPSIAVEADGDFIVTWSDYDGYGVGIFAHRFNSAGVRQGLQFQVNTLTARPSTDPRWRPRATATLSSSGRASTKTGGDDRLLRRLRATVHFGRHATRHRVPGEHLHVQRPGESAGRLGQRRRLHGRMAESNQDSGMAMACSAGTSTRWGQRWPWSSRSALAPSTTRSVPTSRPTPTATSSSSGRATSRKPPAAVMESSPSASTRRAWPRPRSSRSIPTRSGPRATPRSRLGPTVTSRGLEERQPGKSGQATGTTASSPALQRDRGAAGGRVPGQRLHSRLSTVSAGRRRQRRRLRRHLGEPLPGWRRKRGVRAPCPRQWVIGPEFQANTYAFDGQTPPSLTGTAMATSSSPGTPRSPGRQLLRRVRAALLAAAARQLDIDGNGVVEPLTEGCSTCATTSASPAPRSPAARSAPTARAAPAPRSPRTSTAWAWCSTSTTTARSTRSPTACSPSGSCSDSPGRRSPTRRGAQLQRPLRRLDHRAVPADARLTASPWTPPTPRAYHLVRAARARGSGAAGGCLDVRRWGPYHLRRPCYPPGEQGGGHVEW